MKGVIAYVYMKQVRRKKGFEI